jgi:O-antigen ligase
VYLTTIFSAIAHVGLWLFLENLPDTGYVYLAIAKKFFDPNDSGVLYVGPMADGSTRVFWISSLFVIFGLHCAVRNFLRSKQLISLIVIALFVWTIYVTQTRSLVVGLPIGVVLGFFVHRLTARGRASVPWAALVVATILVSVTFFLTIAPTTDILGALGLTRGTSDEGRNIQIGPLLEAWSDSPVIGHGFGTQAAMTRSYESPFSYEMSILALYMKVGILGAIVSSLYFIYLITSFIPNRDVLVRQSKEFGALFGAVFIFCFAFNTNPYLSNSVGVAIVFLCCIELAALSYEEKALRR